MQGTCSLKMHYNSQNPMSEISGDAGRRGGVVQTFNSVDNILKCEYSNEGYKVYKNFM